MNCELYQNSVGIGKLQKLLSFSKDFSFFDNYVYIFTFSLAPNEKIFVFLGFIGVTHTHSAYEDGRIVCNFGFVSLLIIS